MRIKFTLLFILTSFYSFSQEEKVVQVPRCRVDEKSFFDGLAKSAPVTSFDPTKNLTGKVSGLNISIVSSSKIRTCGQRSIPSDSKPLLIVDRKICELGKLNEIDPNHIESVSILKSAEATALYGPDGVNGVLYVSTRGIVVSSHRGPLPFASISLVGTSLGMPADENGFASISRLPEIEGQIVEVSYAGFQSKHFRYSGIRDTIYLEPLVRSENAVVIACGSSRWIRCHFGCRGVTICEKTVQIKQRFETSEIKVFPSLLSRGQSLTLDLNGFEGSDGLLQVIGSDGRTMFKTALKTEKRSNRVRIPTDSHWAAGVYFVQFSDQVHHRVVQQKIILQ